MARSFLLFTDLGVRQAKITAWIVGVWLISIGWSPLVLSEVRTLEIDGSELSMQVIKAELKATKVVKASGATKPQARLLWLPSEYGTLSQELNLAKSLQAYGVESWFPNVYDALFLSPTASAVDEVPTEWIAELISQAHADGVPLWVVGPNKAAQLAVRGLVTWQQQPKSQVGLLLINPTLFLNTPSPGEEARYWSHVEQMNVPVSILQAEQSPRRWRLAELADKLQTQGSDVFVQVVPKVRDRFYFRPDATALEGWVSEELTDSLRQMMVWQLPYLWQLRQAGALEDLTENTVEASKSALLQIYKGNQDRPLVLENLEGKPVDLLMFKGQVVMLNFWASWCPPCVKEMPSMARLKHKLSKQPFEILAVNLAESPEEVRAFVADRSANFPILLDPTGSAVKSWQVFAYPSTYLIDKHGQIRYALFGSTEWDDKEHLQVIQNLLEE